MADLSPAQLLAKYNIAQAPWYDITDPTSKLSSALSGFANGASLGLSKPMVAGMISATNLVQGNPADYSGALQSVNDTQNQSQQANPITYGVANIAGSTLPVSKVGNLVKTALPSLSTFKQGLAVNAGIGAVANGSQSNSISDIAPNAIEGAGFGAALGTAAAGISGGMQALSNKIFRPNMPMHSNFGGIGSNSPVGVIGTVGGVRNNNDPLTGLDFNGNTIQGIRTTFNDLTGKNSDLVGPVDANGVSLVGVDRGSVFNHQTTNQPFVDYVVNSRKNSAFEGLTGQKNYLPGTSGDYNSYIAPGYPGAAGAAGAYLRGSGIQSGVADELSSNQANVIPSLKQAGSNLNNLIYNTGKAITIGTGVNYGLSKVNDYTGDAIPTNVINDISLAAGGLSAGNALLQNGRELMPNITGAGAELFNHYWNQPLVKETLGNVYRGANGSVGYSFMPGITPLTTAVTTPIIGDRLKSLSSSLPSGNLTTGPDLGASELGAKYNIPSGE